ncbi:hypothetical protein NQZ68_003190 [Dissostichus eleginoides]|nr:hypothetical protein NQZ68_003190 [Dissostichus eleginoides]
MWEILLTLRQQEGSDGSSPLHTSLFPSDTDLKDSLTLVPLSGSTGSIEYNVFMSPAILPQPKGPVS